MPFSDICLNSLSINWSDMRWLLASMATILTVLLKTNYYNTNIILDENTHFNLWLNGVYMKE